MIINPRINAPPIGIQLDNVIMAYDLIQIPSLILSPPVLSSIVFFITLSVSLFSIGSTENNNNNNVCILGSGCAIHISNSQTQLTMKEGSEDKLTCTPNSYLLEVIALRIQTHYQLLPT